MPDDPRKRTLEFPPEYLTVLAHYYRAEIYRSVVWRTRLDATTNWAILAMTAAFSWSFTSSETESHILFPITSCAILMLLFIETRRYRFYDLWWTRARMLEGHLVVPVLNPDLNLKQGDWREFLSNDLLLPTYKLSFWEAFARRLASVYIYLFVVLFVGWIARVYTGSDVNGDSWVTIGEFFDGCAYKFLHPIFALGFQLAFTSAILGILIFNWQARTITGEIRRRDPSAPRWPI